MALPQADSGTLNETVRRRAEEEERDMQALKTRLDTASRERVGAVLRTLAGLRRGTGTLAEVAHDARNMVAALSLYCDLLAEAGVLADGHVHFADELRLIAAASRRLVEKLTILAAEEADGGPNLAPGPAMMRGTESEAPRLPGDPIQNLQQELLANRNLLDAVAGLGIAVRVRTEGGARPVRLAPADLTRILVNLVKNAAEAMHSAGSIEITLRELPQAPGSEAMVALLVEDSGPGIPEEDLERVFEPAFTTRGDIPLESGWPATHRGLGLSIARSLVAAAGGRMVAVNRPQGGAQFRIELPIAAGRGDR